MPSTKSGRKRVSQAEVSVAAELMIAALLREVEDFNEDQGYSESLDQEIANLRDIESLASAIKKSVKLQRRRISKTRNAVVAPLYRLPPEILVQIVDRSLGHDGVWLDTRPQPTLRRLTQLRMVSRHWANAIDGYAHLWSNLFSSYKKNALEMAVNMSHQVPLTLVIQGASPPALRSPVFLAKAPGRLVRLSFQNYTYRNPGLLDLVYRNLEDLRLTSVEGLRTAGEVHRLEWRLKTLVLQQTSIPWDSNILRGLTELQIHMKGMSQPLHPTILQLYDIVRLCPNVETLQLCIHPPLALPPSVLPPDVLELPHLQSLRLCMQPTMNGQLALSMHAPRCRDLRVSESMQFLIAPLPLFDSISHAIAAMPDAVRCTVTEEQIANGILQVLSKEKQVILRIPTGESERALQVVTHLFKNVVDTSVGLTLAMSQAGTSTFLNRLSKPIPWSDPPLWALRNLRSLHIQRSDVPIRDLIQFVRLRSFNADDEYGGMAKDLAGLPISLESLTVLDPADGQKLIEVLGVEP